MSIESLVIYGSTARGDQNETSDIDMFAIYSGEYYKMVVKGKLNVAMYPLHLAKKIMQKGGLFALHLKEEGVPLFNECLFNEICSDFNYKDSYSEEIDTATKILEFICDNHKHIKNKLLMNKRISWSVRTILISLSAELRKPVFSKNKLALIFSNDIVKEEDILKLIDLKSKTSYDKKIIKICMTFLTQFGMKLDNRISAPFLKKTIKRLMSDKTILDDY